jgi:hypothetical protein
MTTSFKKYKKLCPKCGFPLNKDDSHNRNFLSPCEAGRQHHSSGNTMGRDSYMSENVRIRGFWSNTVN